jgi:predicted AAA+ superfamily ATPase
MPLVEVGQESGVGRWHTIRLTTLSFYEYLQIKNLTLPPLPKIKSLRDLFDWPQADFYRVTEAAASYVGHFHEYLVRGGFPQTAQVESITQAQRLLREDIIDKVLKRDMTALFGVRRVLDLEHTFLYLCMHDGGLLDMVDLCSNLEVKRPTAQNFIELLESTHLIYRLPPYGYGKDVLRARFKIYLADAAIAPAVMLKGKTILEDPAALGVATETAVFKHLFARYYAQNVRFTYWRGKKDREVDLVAEVDGQIIPFEVKYRAQHTGARELKGLIELCELKKITRGYVVTKSLDDFGLMTGMPKGGDTATQIMRIPAPLLCYWMGGSELNQTEVQD